MPLALPFLIPFAEIAGIAIGAVTTAVGFKALSDKVEDYIEDNPENAQKIFAIIEPEQGLASIFNTEADDGEEISETEEVVEVKPKKLTGKEKGMRMREAALQKKGNYSSPDAEGNYESKRGRMIKAAEELGLASPDLKDNYKKSNFDYKKYFRKADGGMMEYANGGGVGSMMEPKKVPQLVTPSKDGSRPGYRGSDYGDQAAGRGAYSGGSPGNTGDGSTDRSRVSATQQANHVAAQKAARQEVAADYRNKQIKALEKTYGTGKNAGIFGGFNPLSMIAGLIGGPFAGLAMRGLAGIKGGFKGF